MRICIVAEGSYPYITGGVSSWIQSLVSSMPEHEFVIYAIGAEEKLKGNFKYSIPGNIVEIREVFLDSHLSEVTKQAQSYRLNSAQKNVIKSLLTNEMTDWNKLFSIISSKRTKIDKVTDFMASKEFFDMIQEICMEHYSDIPFTEFFWSTRSMLIPLFTLLKSPLPEADLYHSVSTGYAGLIAALGKHLYNKPFVLTEHGIYTREREEEIIKADWLRGQFKDLWIQYFYSLSQCAYSHSDQVISLFNKNREIQGEIGCRDDKIMIIPNGVSIEDYSSLQEKQKEDQAYINVGAIVRVVPIKDIKTMLQSYSIVKNAVPNARFYIFGPYEEEPDYYQECLQLVDALQLKDVYFTGSVNIKHYLGKMDMLVLSSISEGQPLAILEGLASGIPYVCTDVGSCRELIYGLNDGFGEAGYIVPVMHYAEMAEAIITLSRSSDLRAQMGQNGKRRVQALYTKEGFISQYKKIYENTRFIQWQESASS